MMKPYLPSLKLAITNAGSVSCNLSHGKWVTRLRTPPRKPSSSGSHEDAEDVLQTIFLQLIRRQFPPDLRTNPQAYLYRAAVNSSLNIIRRRRHEVLVDDAEHFEMPMRTDASNTELEVRRLYEAIAELKPEAAQILILRYMHNKNDAEIARILGRSRGTIALNLFRSRARLKKLLLTKLGDKP